MATDIPNFYLVISALLLVRMTVHSFSYLLFIDRASVAASVTYTLHRSHPLLNIFGFVMKVHTLYFSSSLFKATYPQNQWWKSPLKQCYLGAPKMKWQHPLISNRLSNWHQWMESSVEVTSILWDHGLYDKQWCYHQMTNKKHFDAIYSTATAHISMIDWYLWSCTVTICHSITNLR